MLAINPCVPSEIRANLLGRTFGKLKVIGFAGRCEYGTQGEKATCWQCRCSCGRIVNIRHGNLVGRGVRSCRECSYPRPSLRGPRFPGSACLRETWVRLRSSGSLCRRWERYTTFVREMGEPHEGARIHRIDVKKPHSRTNSFWGTLWEIGERRIDLALSFLGTTREDKQVVDRLRRVSRQRIQQIIAKGRRMGQWPIRLPLP